MAPKANSTANATPKTRGPRVALPASIASSEDVVWPGQSRNTANSGLRNQLTEDVTFMEKGSVRKYMVSGDKEQNAFLTLFRSVVANVHAGTLGAQAIKQDDCVIVRLSDPITRPRKAK